MALSHFFNRRNVTILSIFAFGGSYLLLKSRALQQKRQQQLEGDYSVTTSRSGGGF